MTDVAGSVDPPAPLEGEFRCEGCGYLLTGLKDPGNCPECGRAYARAAGSRRRPSAFEARPSVASLVRTALAALFRPARFYEALSSRPMGTGAAWFARCNLVTAAAFLSVALCGHVMLHTGFKLWLMSTKAPPPPASPSDRFSVDLYLTRLYWGDEPVLFGLLLAPVAIVFYALIASLTRGAARLATYLTAQRGAPRREAVVVRALRFHSVHWVVVGFAAAVTVGGPWSLELAPLAAAFYLILAAPASWAAARTSPVPHPPPVAPRPASFLVRFVPLLVVVAVAAWYFPLLDSDHFDHLILPRSDPRPYRFALAAEALLVPAYLLFTGRKAVRHVMWANDEPTK